MKGMMAIALWAAASLITGGTVLAGTPQAQYRTVQFSSGYLQRDNCNVNGQVYPVGQDFKVWGYDAFGNSSVIGWVNWSYGNVWIFHGVNGVVLQVPCW